MYTSTHTHSSAQSKSRLLLLLAAVALSLGLLFDILFFDSDGFGINFPFFISAALAGALLLAREYQKPVHHTATLLLAPALFFASMIAIRASALLTFFNFFATLFLLLVATRSYTQKLFTHFVPRDYFEALLLPPQFIKPFFDTCSALFALRIWKWSESEKGGRHIVSREVVRGTLAAVLAVSVFSLLFAAADEVFAHFFAMLFSPALLEQFFRFMAESSFFTHAALIGFVTAAALGLFGYLFLKSHEEPLAHPSRARSASETEVKILLGSIAALFFVFITLQITYLFGGESHFIAQGITYAEYARKGFFELILVALLSYGIISFAEKQIVKKDDTHMRSFKLLSGVLVAEVVVILISASLRLSLYENAYGFTTIRLYSHALMIWIGVMLILLARHIYISSSRATFTLHALASVIIFLCAMNTLNPDAFIAKQNIARYRETGKIDTLYLAELSSDAVPYTVILLSEANAEVRNRFESDLYAVRSQPDGNQSGFWSFNLSKSVAFRILGPWFAEYSIRHMPGMNGNSIESQL